ncbi:hypothetical protein DL93DRAFT_2126493 [Clavulina sp. PMI_390]|nr:hypothetical protein DL93DRAFT_2126493 [Clavulina sp. PMI_390]
MRSQSSILPRISEPAYTSLADNKSSTRERLMKYPWKRIAIGAGAVFVLYWLFGTSTYRPYSGAGGAVVDDSTDYGRPANHDSPSWGSKPAPPHYGDDLPVKQPPSSPSNNDENIPSSSKKHPTSPETDPDRSSTTYCTSPYSSASPLVQYALMIDAGSQGSRIHVYKFNNCKPSLQLEYEVFVQTRPGLSKYAGDPQAAAESLDTLMEEAVKVVPPALVKCTPVAVKATAGLRLLGDSQATEILDAVRHRLSTKYSFELPNLSADGLEDRVAIMDGKDEGVYAWITSNYLLGSVGPAVPAGSQSYAVLDLGGASTQIVFEPTFGPQAKDKFAEGEHKYALKFGGKDFTLYQHSYLGYGLMKARQSVHSLVEYMGDLSDANHNKHPSGPRVLANPCIARSTSREVKLSVDTPTERTLTMSGHDVASFDSCLKLVSLVLAKDSLCTVKPCSFDGQYQPSIVDTFEHGGILALSYFTDRLQPFVRAGLVGKYVRGTGKGPNTDASTMQIREIASLAEKVCLGPKSWKKHFASAAASSEGALTAVMEELETRPETCLDMTFMYALLRLGYEFGDERTVRLEKKLGGIELGWALGAALALVDGQLTCKA